MPFRFTLKAVLRLREIMEKSELHKLQAVAAQIVRAKAEIESLDADSNLGRRKMQDEAVKGITGADLHFEALREQSYRERRSLLAKEIQKLELARTECQKRYMETRRKREILSNLQERQRAIYDLEVSKCPAESSNISMSCF
jgi:flagellar export protein FliJ